CGATLVGAYCHQCGQHGHVERKLLHVFEEFLHGIVHFDAKAWRTLPKLVARPGTLTFDYIHGKRARFVSPLATFLFVVFVMFFVFAFVGQPKINGAATAADLRQQASAADAAQKTAEAKLAAAISARDKLKAEGGVEEAISEADAAVKEAQEDFDTAKKDAASMAGKLARREEMIAQLRTARTQLDVNEAKAKASNDSEALSEIAVSKGLLDRALARSNEASADGIVAKVGPSGEVDVSVVDGREEGMNTIFEEIKRAEALGKITVNTGSKKLDEKVHAKLRNPELGWYKIQNAAYKFSFLLVPLSLPFLTFLFLFKKDVTLYDHVVFILYSLSFMSLLLTAIAVIGGVAPSLASPLATLALVAPPLHLFFHLGGTYRLKLVSALWRTFVLCIFALICLAIFIGLIVILGLTG
ncbi:MAG: DUF3667 domain-containing protein, partial [Alphaproteobacteria bacterium]|nr:DUF3667 domain-containing protein [Alphaproteobacteria bacterium]